MAVEPGGHDACQGSSRRQVLKKAGVGVGVVWASPALLSAKAVASVPSGRPPHPCTGGRAQYAEDFNSIASAGPEWSTTTIATSPSGEKFLGEFGNQTVSLSFNDLATHSLVRIAFKLYIIRTWDGNGPSNGPDFWDFAVDGSTKLHTTFSNDCSGLDQSYPEDYPASHGHRDGECNGDNLGYGVACRGNAVYCLNFDVPHTACSVRFDFTGSGLQALSDESWGLDDVAMVLVP